MSNLIFDFDGTIADSFWLAVEIFRHLAKGKHATDDAEIEALRDLSAKQIARRLGIRWWQIPKLAAMGRKIVHGRLDEVKPIDGIVPVLRALHEQGHELSVVSSNSHINIAHFLETNGVRDCFEHIYGSIGLFAKAGTLRKIVRQNKLDVADCYYIGDEVRDLEAARRVGMPCVSVAWGYNNLGALEARHPKILLRDPKELLTLFPVQKGHS
jgi:phosphoglycolate phosphatase